MSLLGPSSLRRRGLLVAGIATVAFAVAGGCGGGLPAATETSSAWRELTPGPQVDEGPHTLAFSDARRGWLAVFLAQGVLTTVDGGRHWAQCRGRIVGATEVSPALPASVDRLPFVTSVASFGGDVYLAYCGQVRGVSPRHPSARSGVLVSGDRGRTWRPLLALNGRYDWIVCMTGLDRDRLWVLCGNDATSPGGSWLLRTVDGGDTWRRVWQSPSGETATSAQDSLRELYSMRYFDRRTGWALGNIGPVRTTDGGATWANTAPDGVFGTNLAPIDGRHAWTAYAMVEEYDVGGGLWSTADGGRSWVEHEAFSGTPVYDAYFADDQTGWAVCVEGIFMTRDAGADWVRERDMGGLIGDFLVLARGGDYLYVESGGTLLTRRVD